jgi:hypothetical protein
MRGVFLMGDVVVARRHRLHGGIGVPIRSLKRIGGITSPDSSGLDRLDRSGHTRPAMGNTFVSTIIIIE